MPILFDPNALCHRCGIKGEIHPMNADCLRAIAQKLQAITEAGQALGEALRQFSHSQKIGHTPKDVPGHEPPSIKGPGPRIAGVPPSSKFE